jgi:hypothetical protein
MSDRQYSDDGDEFGTDKPRNKRRYGGKSSKKKDPGAMDRVRSRRPEPNDEDNFLDDDFDLEEENWDDSDEFDGYEEGWEFEDEDVR